MPINSRPLPILIDQLIKSKMIYKVVYLSFFVFFILVFNVIGEVRMNVWQGDFFRAVEQRNLYEVARQAGFFLILMFILLATVVSQFWLLDQLKIRLRECLTESLLEDWTKPGVAYRLGMTAEEPLNADQRLQEDVRNFTEKTGDLGHGMIRSSLFLVSFVGVLWGMSEGTVFQIGRHLFVVPGYMVWIAIFYAGLGSWLATIAGRPLIKLHEDRYTEEANLRYALVHMSDNSESIALYSGERDERKVIDNYLKKVLEKLRTLSFASARLAWVSIGHGWIVVILPVVVALPAYIQGNLDFGGLMMVVGAFNQVQQSLRWFVENFKHIVDWRASYNRVVEFIDAIANVDEYETETIQLLPHPQKHLVFDQTSISLLDGKVVISDATAHITPGERVLIVGESGSGKSTLIRAVSGLWPWGSGRILLPPKQDMMFLPQRPYLPLGKLAAAIAYPQADGIWTTEQMVNCLERVNLKPFIQMLFQDERWEKVMSLGEQQRLAFCRLLLHKPTWVFLDEATSALDDENQELMMAIFEKELKSSSVISIGHRPGLERFHNRTLHLVKTHSGRVLARKPRAKTSKFLPKRLVLRPHYPS